LRIAPAKLLSDWFEKAGKAKKDGTTNIKADEKTRQYDPPSIKNLLKHRSCKAGLVRNNESHITTVGGGGLLLLVLEATLLKCLK